MFRIATDTGAGTSGYRGRFYTSRRNRRVGHRPSSETRIPDLCAGVEVKSVPRHSCRVARRTSVGSASEMAGCARASRMGADRGGSVRSRPDHRSDLLFQDQLASVLSRRRPPDTCCDPDSPASALRRCRPTAAKRASAFSTLASTAARLVYSRRISKFHVPLSSSVRRILSISGSRPSPARPPTS